MHVSPFKAKLSLQTHLLSLGTKFLALLHVHTPFSCFIAPNIQLHALSSIIPKLATHCSTELHSALC